MVITQNAVNPNQGAAKFSFPCRINSPKLGVPTGNPNPKKSRAERATIPPASINGIYVIVVTKAFGRIWRIIIRKSLTPNALADFT